LSAQSLPSAEGPSVSIWVGAEISTFNPDYGCSDNSPFMCGGQQLIGIAPYVDANHLFFSRLGAEVESRFLHWRGPGSGLTESSYLVGPRFGLLSLKRSVFLSGKVLVGSANLHLPSGAAGSGSYFAYAPGAVAEFRITRRLTARADYEYQIWPSFKGVATATTTGTGGLTPNGFSLGVSYAILRSR
jgi:opacity protein-like surface antigen